jgi:hypothetical protein
MKVTLKRVKSALLFICIALATQAQAIGSQQASMSAGDVLGLFSWASALLWLDENSKNPVFPKPQGSKPIEEKQPEKPLANESFITRLAQKIVPVAGIGLINFGLFQIGRSTLSILQSHPKIGVSLLVAETLGLSAVTVLGGAVASLSFLMTRGISKTKILATCATVASFPISFGTGCLWLNLPNFIN